MARRMLHAARADGAFAAVQIERKVACGAPGGTEKIQLSPTCGTQAVVARDDRPACGATRRQRGIERKAKRHDEAMHHIPLSDGARIGTSTCVTPEIFDRSVRRLRRDRMMPAWRKHAFLRDWMIEGLIDRLSSVTREFHHVLDLGCFDGSPIPGLATDARIARLDPGFVFARTAGGLQADEDRLPFADRSFDLVLSAGVLDQVSDLPGALTLARRALKPDGLLLAAFLGAGSLPALRAAMRVGDSDRAAARIHPQVDVRSAGDLLVRAGFALPVADVESLDVRYASLFGLMRDLRGMGAANLLHDRAPLNRTIVSRAATAFADMAEPDGKIRERFNAIIVTAWSPAPSQPQPARRGSGGASMAEALGPKR